jgi:hypothetical protein
MVLDASDVSSFVTRIGRSRAGYCPREYLSCESAAYLAKYDSPRHVGIRQSKLPRMAEFFASTMRQSCTVKRLNDFEALGVEMDMEIHRKVPHGGIAILIRAE